MTALTSRPSLRRPAADAWPVAAFIVFVVAWKLVVVLGRLPVFILPAPEQVAARFVTAWTDGTMAPHAWTTIVEVALGFAVGAVAGVVAGYGLARSSVFERVLSPYLVAAQAVPILALAPLLAVWFGPGLLAKVVICGLIVFFPVAVATMVGIRSVDRGLLELARSLRATRRRVLVLAEGVHYCQGEEQRLGLPADVEQGAGPVVPVDRKKVRVERIYHRDDGERRADERHNSSPAPSRCSSPSSAPSSPARAGRARRHRPRPS